MEVSFGAITAEGDRVCVEARGSARFVDGRTYDNRAHFLITLREGRIVSIKEYLDTDHVARVLSAHLRDPKSVVRRLYEEVVGRGDMALLEQLIAADAVDHNAQRQGWPAGREGFRRHVAFFHEVFSELEVTVEDLLTEDGRTVDFWSLRGTHRGKLWGIEPTGRRISGHTVSILKVRDGKVIEYESRPERLAFLLQLGSLGIYAAEMAGAG